MTRIQVGNAAPDFHILGHDGNELALSDYRGKQVVVLFFYPRNDTAVCTAEACGFRDAYEDFVAAGAALLGVTTASAAAQHAFASKHDLQYHLLADEHGSLRKAYGVSATLGIIPGRVTYVIDKQGIVRHIFCAQFAAQRHVDEALKVVRSLA
jgi:peroxiredoxin Q/BCP